MYSIIIRIVQTNGATKSRHNKKNQCYIAPSHRPFYNKEKDKTIYDQLNNILERFKKIDVIAESIHGFDTNTNEAMNTAVARRCPKFKHLGQTMTL